MSKIVEEFTRRILARIEELPETIDIKTDWRIEIPETMTIKGTLDLSPPPLRLSDLPETIVGDFNMYWPDPEELPEVDQSPSAPKPF